MSMDVAKETTHAGQSSVQVTVLADDFVTLPAGSLMLARRRGFRSDPATVPPGRGIEGSAVVKRRSPTPLTSMVDTHGLITCLIPSRDPPSSAGTVPE
jgi:hypothetical protein